MSCCGAFILPQDLPAAAPRAARPPFVLTGGHVLAGLITFFVIVASVNGYMMRMAITTMPGLDARNGYDASQAYNDQIARAAAQGAAHWTANARITQAEGGVRIALDLTGDGVDGPLAVTATLEHPAARFNDHKAQLRPIAPGRYEAIIPGRITGAWTLAIEARDPSTGARLFLSRNRTVVGG